MKLVSIIVPVYNAEDMLPRCLNAILTQTFTHFELVLVDDGSTDQSLDVCKEFKKKDHRIRIMTQENSGPSAARNKGMEHAKGRFVTFIDADDYVDPEFLESFFLLEKNPIQSVVIQGYHRTFFDDRTEANIPMLKKYDSSEFSELFQDLILIRKYPFIWCKMFCMDTIRKQNLQFDKEIKFGEDLIFFLNYVKFANAIFTINKSCYHYIYASMSLTSALYPYHSEVKRLNVVRELLSKLTQKFNFSSELQQFHQQYMNRYLHRAISALYLPGIEENKSERIAALRENTENKNFELIRNMENKGVQAKLILNLSNMKLFRLLDFVLWNMMRMRRLVRGRKAAKSRKEIVYGK